MSSLTIDSKLHTAKRQSELLYKNKQTWQEKVDNMLDRMNSLNAILTELHSLLLGLNFEIERDFKGFKESKEAPETILEITKPVTQILILVRRSDLYPGVKTMFASLREEIRYLKELVQDRAVGLDLENDPDIDNIMDKFLKASFD